MSSERRLKLLWLCSWYPSEEEPFNGDFIQRHAWSVGLLHNVHVVHVVKSKRIGQKVAIRINKVPAKGVTEEIIYYSSGSGWLGKIYSQLILARHYFLAVKRYRKLYGPPDLLHYHTGMHLGLVAWVIRVVFRQPYVLSEHWSGFFFNADQRVEDLDVYRKLGLRKIIRNALSVQVVSLALRDVFTKRYKKDSVVVIPNVVDVELFSIGVKKEYPFTFVHVSDFTPQKGASHLLAAIKLLKERGLTFRVQLVGVRSPDLNVELREYDNVSVLGEVSHDQVAGIVREAHAMIHPSLYETFGCVLIEAFASGIPVVAYDLPVFQELIVPGRNGLVAKEMTPESLADAMEEMMISIGHYNADQIRSDAIAKYSMPVISSQFDIWYRSCLSSIAHASIGQ